MGGEANEIGAQRVADAQSEALLEVLAHLMNVAVVDHALVGRVVIGVVGRLMEVELANRRNKQGVFIDQAPSRILGDAITVLDDIDAAIESVADGFVADAVRAHLQLVEMRLVHER